MLREDQLKFCRVCTLQSFDPEKGIICSLTGSPANFEQSCTSYSEDEVLKVKYQSSRETKVLANKTISSGKRFLNFLLDMLFLYIMAIILGVIVGIASYFLSVTLLDPDPGFLKSYLIGFIVIFIYYAFWEILTGRTPAKYITRCKVVDENGNKPSPGRILLRTLCRFLPFEAFSFLGAPDEGWHDKISKTLVIDSRNNYFSEYE